MKLKFFLILLPGYFGPFAMFASAEVIKDSMPAEEILNYENTPESNSDSATIDINKILTDYYQQTSNYLKTVEAYKKAANSYQKSQDEAPMQTRKIRKKISKPVTPATVESMSIAEDVPLPEIGQRLYKERDLLDAEKRKLAELTEKIAQLQPRLTEAKKRIREAKQRAVEIKHELEQPVDEDELEAVTEARSWALEAEDLQIDAEIFMLENEIQSQPVRRELLEAKRDELKREIQQLEQRVAILTESMNRRIEGEIGIAEEAELEGKEVLRSKEKSSLHKELERQRARLEKKINFSGNIAMALKIQEGNTDKQELELDGELNLRRIKDRLNVIGHLENDKAKSVQTAYNWFLISKYDYFISKKLFYGAGLSFEQDEFADLDLRTRLGPHVGYQFYESHAMNLQLQGGVALVSEDYLTNPNLNYIGGTWVLSFDKYFFDELFQFYAYQSGLDQFGRVNKLVLKSWAGIRFPLIYNFFLSAELKREYDSQPVNGKLKLDTTQNLKIGYKW